jgi:hypothetical protein
MKNKIKFLGIIALIVIIGFSMITCDDDNGDDNSGGGGGGGGNSGATLGQETLSITDQQVYTIVVDETNGTISYPVYTDSISALNDSYTPPLGTAVITNGKFTYTQTGAPAGSALMGISDWLDLLGNDNITANPVDTKIAIIDVFKTTSNDYRLSRMNLSLSNYNASTQTGTMTNEEVMYVYVDKNVTITAAKVGPEIEDGDDDDIPMETTQEAINLSLTKGWNAVTVKIINTVTTSKISYTYSVIKGDTGRWILEDDK